MRIAGFVVVMLLAASCAMGGQPPNTGVDSAPPTIAPGTPNDPSSTLSDPTPSEVIPTSSATAPVTTGTTAPSTSDSASPTTTSTPPPTLPEGVTPPPEWLGTRVLPIDENGLGETQDTPAELQDRRFTTDDVLPPPPDDSFHSSIDEAPDDVLERSTWVEECPIGAEDLAYVTVSFVGFDARLHSGELLVDASVAEDMVYVFERLFEARFPIEEMRITSQGDLDAPPTGDGNVTSAFSCRPVVGEDSGWSEHALGTAVDINPFHNPYVKDDIVIPELASAYLDRERDLPGMIVAGDVATEVFAEIGWTWGGTWNTLKDYQHFSMSGG